MKVILSTDLLEECHKVVLDVEGGAETSVTDMLKVVGLADHHVSGVVVVIVVVVVVVVIVVVVVVVVVVIHNNIHAKKIHMKK